MSRDLIAALQDMSPCAAVLTDVEPLMATMC